MWLLCCQCIVWHGYLVTLMAILFGPLFHFPPPDYDDDVRRSKLDWPEMKELWWPREREGNGASLLPPQQMKFPRLRRRSSKTGRWFLPPKTVSLLSFFLHGGLGAVKEKNILCWDDAGKKSQEKWTDILPLRVSRKEKGIEKDSVMKVDQFCLGEFVD